MPDDNPTLTSASTPACGCPETWLIEHASDSGGAWDRRVLGSPAVGDAHATPAGGVHVWTGTEWGSTDAE